VSAGTWCCNLIMPDTLKLAFAQLNLEVGDVAGNAARMVEATAEARRRSADLVVFPELALCGYPPEDLLFHAGLRQQVESALEALCAASTGIAALVGYPEYGDGAIYNAAAFLADGQHRANYRKRCLPNYSVFDEQRYFRPGHGPLVVEWRGVRLGIGVCEDVWEEQPIADARAAGASLYVVPNGSPFEVRKQQQREAMLAERARANALPIAYGNLVGGQDELVFDGGSCVIARDGQVAMRAPAFEEGLFECSLEVDAVLGLSGGVDSALTLAIAVDALGREAVRAVMMPYRYTSAMSIEDARLQAATMGVDYQVLPIADMVAATRGTLAGVFAGLPEDATEENIQARCRGMLLMAISNKTGRMVLATGNKSEMAVGYATLYGDMAGGFAPIKDCTKTLVYRLARYRNGIAPVIPERVLTRAPSAELRPGQKDSDSLPPYAVLDPILDALMIENRSVDDITARGFDRAVVTRVLEMVRRAEYKRRQAAPGVRLTSRAFGRDWRYPITSGYRHRD
jgi:NAD+ synthase (glutamine-hydrolysing)